ncbi:hypothetical protein J4573_17020 [Actinomadura barringtoniae]|uniref:Uncharacterized protein n=1 Tax=Actinomadura barringtoniae TaxID=1427535 RepID=A0A939T3Z3_9ACTN|nr:hypothetical protein [Actinomadura barringtoniae]MBO2448808.1 hypothetical protein [Actinomadura barringtoniae]
MLITMMVANSQARTVGAVQLALVTGLMVQWMTDPEHALTAAEVIEGIQALNLPLRREAVFNRSDRH